MPNSVRYSNNGGAPKLWCVELVPKRKQFGEPAMKDLLWLAKGMPTELSQAFLWAAQAVAGLADNREARFARVQQRLVVFRDRTEAARRARKETDEFWVGKVRAVKVL